MHLRFVNITMPSPHVSSNADAAETTSTAVTLDVQHSVQVVNVTCARLFRGRCVLLTGTFTKPHLTAEFDHLMVTDVAEAADGGSC